MELILISDDKIDCKVSYINKEMIINGYLKNPINYKSRLIIAPNPPDKITSYSGSALPFPNEEIALEKTKNIYEIGTDGIINVKFSFPNSFYNPEGTKKIISPFLIIVDNNRYIYETKDICPLKTLTDRVRGNPSFYALKEILLPVADAEDTMFNYAKAKVKYNIA